jgi:flagellar biosynthetic protein FlhB
MADNDQKTEQPTHRRLTQARTRGQVVHSREVNSLFMLLAGAFIVLVMMPSLSGRMETTLARFLDSDSLIEGGDVLWGAVRNLCAEIAGAMLVPLLLLVLAAIGGTFIQNGFIFAPEKIGFNPSRLSPLAGFRRLFSLNSLFEFLKSFAKFTAVMVLVGWLAMPAIRKIELLVGIEPAVLLGEIHRMLLHVAIGVLLLVAGLAALDYGWQYFNFMKQMRMSKQEVKEESKQAEGDPLVKSRLRQVRLERTRRRMMAAVPTAAVVVTNPTHYAVALKYEMGAKGAPKLVAKGVDFLAQKIREIAAAHDVPVVENPPLARALYGSVDLDQEIPPEHYRAVAEIISYVFRLKGKLKPQ